MLLAAQTEYFKLLGCAWTPVCTYKLFSLEFYLADVIIAIPPP